MSSKKIAVISDKCVACGNCMNGCPLNSIEIHKGMRAVVNESKCVGCGRCMKECPAGVITIIRKRGVE